MKKVKYYSPLEEKINILSHALGLVLSVIALILLLTQKNISGNLLYQFSFAVFGLGLIILYAASTAYHRSKAPELRSRLRVFDHAAIYVLIAATYTPFTLITLNSPVGWAIFYTVWLMALTGVVLKLFFTGRFVVVSTLMYVFMGWLIVFAIDDLVNTLSEDGLLWLVVGGISYTVGAVLYAIKKIKFNHAIFHVFVLLGSISHFISVYFYIFPVA